MKQAWKRILSVAFVLIMVLSLAVPAFADDGAQPRTGKITVMMPGKGQSTLYVMIASGDSDFTMNRSDVKVSKGSSNAKLVGFEKSIYSSEYSHSYYNDYDKTWRDSYNNQYGSFSYYALVNVTKPGTAKITYKLNGSTYTINLKVVNYVNPVKSVKLNGIKGGANFASATASQRYATFRQNSTIKDAVLKIAAKSGWKLTNITITDLKTGVFDTANFGSKGVSSFTFDYGKMTKGHHYSISAMFTNSKTGISNSVYYTLN